MWNMEWHWFIDSVWIECTKLKNEVLFEIIPLISSQIHLTIFPGPNTSKALPHPHKNQQQPKIPLFALTKG